jgi:hypothetical protein
MTILNKQANQANFFWHGHHKSFSGCPVDACWKCRFTAMPSYQTHALQHEISRFWAEHSALDKPGKTHSTTIPELP